jgi:hypothetical protein
VLTVNKIATSLLAISLCVALGAQTAQSQAQPTRITNTRDLVKYVGTYPCSNGLLHQQVLLSSLRKTLDGDYQAYREHMRLSGCGAIEKRDGFLLMDVSQLHVGGFTSLIFIRLSDGAIFLFWLKSTVANKNWSFYGQRPIPATVSQTVESELNKEWGHVARFSVHGENIEIQLNDSRYAANVICLRYPPGPSPDKRDSQKLLPSDEKLICQVFIRYLSHTQVEFFQPSRL